MSLLYFIFTLCIASIFCVGCQVKVLFFPYYYFLFFYGCGTSVGSVGKKKTQEKKTLVPLPGDPPGNIGKMIFAGIHYKRKKSTQALYMYFYQHPILLAITRQIHGSGVEKLVWLRAHPLLHQSLASHSDLVEFRGSAGSLL